MFLSKKIIIIFIMINLSIIGYLLLVPNPTCETPVINESEIIVDIKGEVNNPGVYSLTTSDRLIDLINLAGGFTEEADQLRINLATKLTDEMVIVVPKIKNNDDNEQSKISINTATKDELMSLPGIGAVKAEAIINFREENDGFKTLEELLLVSGIGDVTFNEIKNYVTL